MTKVKNLITNILLLCLMAGVLMVFTACGGSDHAKVMNLSINPAIELILDKNDKVVSVNAINDEGNFIIANATFVGLDVEDAVQLFLETTEENGFIIEGNVSSNENQFKVQISGDEVQRLYKKVKSTTIDFAEKSGNINITLSLDNELTKDYLEGLVAECMQELTTEEIDGMSEEELIAKLQESREETKNIFSQELKDLYYESRAEEILKEKFEAIKTQISSMITLPDLGIDLGTGLDFGGFKTQFNSKFDAFSDKLDEYKSSFEAEYLTATSVY